MANTTYTPGGCAGGCGRPVPANRVLCPPCSALVHCTEPYHHAAPTVQVATAATMRVPAYVERQAVA